MNGVFAPATRTLALAAWVGPLGTRTASYPVVGLAVEMLDGKAVADPLLNVVDDVESLGLVSGRAFRESRDAVLTVLESPWAWTADEDRTRPLLAELAHEAERRHVESIARRATEAMLAATKSIAVPTEEGVETLN